MKFELLSMFTSMKTVDNIAHDYSVTIHYSHSISNGYTFLRFATWPIKCAQEMYYIGAGGTLVGLPPGTVTVQAACHSTMGEQLGVTTTISSSQCTCKYITTLLSTIRVVYVIEISHIKQCMYPPPTPPPPPSHLIFRFRVLRDTKFGGIATK